MKRIILTVLVLVGLTGCTGLGSEYRRGDTTSSRYVPEPTTPGIHVSGQVRIGVSTGG